MRGARCLEGGGAVFPHAMLKYKILNGAFPLFFPSTLQHNAFWGRDMLTIFRPIKGRWGELDKGKRELGHLS